jgi:hypothetical protein
MFGMRRLAALAQHFGTDVTVKNPSRIDRLAGTISYPPAHKQARRQDPDGAADHSRQIDGCHSGLGQS